MAIQKICILGGTGFVGRHLTARLNTLGFKIRIITRYRERHRSLLVLPSVELLQANVHDPKILKELFSDMDAVINLIGILNEQGHEGKGFYYAHAELARKIVEACHQCKIKRLLHMSALHADAANAPSFYLRSKGEAENHIHTFGQSIAVTSFRPSVIFGREDNFFNRFARLLKRIPLIFPLACPNSRFAPVYVGDVVNAFCKALNDKSTYKKRIDLCGPEVYTLKALVEYTAKCLDLKRKIIGLPRAAAIIQAFLMEYFVPGKPFSIDNYKSLKIDSICGTSTDPTFTSINTVVPRYLNQDFSSKQRYTRYRQYARRDAGK